MVLLFLCVCVSVYIIRVHYRVNWSTCLDTCFIFIYFMHQKHSRVKVNVLIFCCYFFMYLYDKIKCVCVYSRWMYQYEGTVCEKWSQKTGSNVFFWRLCLYEPEWILYKGKGFADKRNVILWSIWQWDKYTRYVKSKVWSLFITTF